MRQFLAAPRDCASLRLCVISLCTALQTVACAQRPPADFAPDPGLIGQIRDIQIIPEHSNACPGATIHATYDAVLADGSRVPFARSYDAKHPPRLHVVLLDRESPEAVSEEDGAWTAERDPLQTVSTGFRLTATLRAKPSVTSTVVVPPDYGCMHHRFAFSGAPGGLAGLKGGDGPDVTIRLAMVRSPFHERLYVAAIEVGGARPFYVLGDASAVAPADWLIVESQGGAGGAGLPGIDGMDGAPGAPGCPGRPGFPGWSGSAGGAGGAGGSGGHSTAIVPEDQRFLAKLVDGRSWGGSGGPGGSGGRGGRGGKGGQGLFDANNQPCADGSDGASGGDGIAGQSGSQGASWPGSVVVTAPTKNLFGGQVPPGLAALLKGVPRGR